jgi:hypothetical protein
MQHVHDDRGAALVDRKLKLVSVVGGSLFVVGSSAFGGCIVAFLAGRPSALLGCLPSLVAIREGHGLLIRPGRPLPPARAYDARLRRRA